MLHYQTTHNITINYVIKVFFCRLFINLLCIEPPRTNGNIKLNETITTKKPICAARCSKLELWGKMDDEGTGYSPKKDD